MIEQLVHKEGEQAFFFEGRVGAMEACLTWPEHPLVGDWLAVLGHPHSLQGGTMNNKVVTTLARAFKSVGIPSLRFNFRGVGQSAGVYDQGIGEAEDMQALIEQWQSAHFKPRLICAGFSFGSYVAYRAAQILQPELLLTIAPPVHHYDYQTQPQPRPWVIFQGEDDEVVPPELVYEFAARQKPPLPLIRFEQTGHFFHGKLIELKDSLISVLQDQGILPCS